MGATAGGVIMSFDVSRLGEIEGRIGQIESRLQSGGPVGGGTGGGGASFAQSLERASAGIGTTAAVPGAAGGTGTNPVASLPPPPHWLRPAPVTPAPVDPTSAAGAAVPSVAGVARWEGLIQKYAGRYGVDADLVRAVMTKESDGDPRIVSRAGAMGLMQLMPATARGAGVTDPFDPEQNVRAGVALLKEHLGRYRGDVRLALAAYNAGPGNVAKHGGVPPFRETQDYVRKILSRLDAAEATAR